MRFRPYLVVGLWAGGILSVLLIIAVSLWCILGVLGDSSGATVARVLTLLVGIAWLVDLAVMVALLALREISAETRLPLDEEM